MYGWRGRANSSGVVAVSTTNPAYITQIRWVMSATTPRSWVMIRTAVPLWPVSWRMTSMTCAWIVTSSAVVGSSAMSSRGLQRERHRDHHALAHPAAAAGAGSAQPAARRRGCPTIVEQLGGAPVGLGPASSSRGASMPSVSWVPIVRTGLRLVSGSWKTIAISSPRTWRSSSSAEREQVAAAEEDATALDPAGGPRQQPGEGEAGDALAAAGLADEAERLAGQELEADAVDGVDGRVVRAEADDEVLDAQQRLAVGAGDRRRGRVPAAAAAVVGVRVVVATVSAG